MKISRIAAAVGLLTALSLGQGDTAAIDDCRYADDAAAQAAWKPMRGSTPAAAATLAGVAALKLSCDFAGEPMERASWDRTVNLDLVRFQGIQFKFYSPNLAPVSQFSIYFQSGNGWYSTSFFPEYASAWNTITIDKASTRTEGSPAGWGSIRTIRISAWKGRGENTAFYMSDIRGIGVLGVDASIAILRGEGEFSGTVATTLTALGLRYATVTDQDVTAARLRDAKVLIIPNSPSMPDAVAAEVRKYMDGGGKVIGFYAVPSKLRAALNIEGGAHIKAEPAGQFSAIQFAKGALEGAPSVVAQRSWNISGAKAVPGKSKVVATWFDDQGKSAGQAAIVASANAMWMTHVLLKDDAPNKQRMLMAMLGSLAPDLWRQSVDGAIAGIGRIGPAHNLEEASALIPRQGAADVAKIRDEARHLRTAGKYPEAAKKAADAQDKLMDVFARAQHPEPGEFRAFWCHRAMGVDGMDWDAAIKRLAENGFTAILPNMLWGGAAFYDSKVLPVARAVSTEGDQIAKCLAAAKKYGLQTHVWKVNFNTGREAPPAFIEKMRRESRLQASASGKEEPWLCPSHPENQKLEVASMVEVARNYAVDGIHFDYIRYPDSNHCFCDGCRRRFSEATGTIVLNWPRDVIADGPQRQKWLDWRRSNITAVVKAVSEQARAVRPKIKISAAVFRNWEVDRDGVGQDWKLWCERGYLDFVCPMDYSNSDRQFEGWVESQQKWAGKTPMYPGIGASASSSQFGADRVIGQIQITRKHKTGGFVIFNYGVNEAKDLMPVLGLGITAKR